MTNSATDLKFYLDDELQAVLVKIKEVEALTELNVDNAKNKRKLMKALEKLEHDIDKVQQILGGI